MLQVYEMSSGQQINKAKSTVFFSKSTKEDQRDSMKNTLGVTEIQNYEKYLGLPSLVGRNKNPALLSQVGREILIKAVVQTIPTYTMNCFKLPIGLCEEIEGLIRRFWWGQREERRKIHWVRWKELCKPKGEGGIGFKDLALYNDVFLAKQAWRLLQNRNSLLYRVFKPKFFPHGTILEAPQSQIGSYAWRNILKGRDVLIEGLRWRVGDGACIKFWTDPWLPSEFLPFVSSQVATGLENQCVSALIKPGTNEWNSELLQQLFSARDISLIESIPLSSKQVEDRLFWPFTPSGSYTVKSGYRFLYKAQSLDNNDYQPEDNGLWKRVWELKTQPKIHNFLWRAIKNAIPTKVNLKRRMTITEDCCEQCKAESEDTVHALWSCPLLGTVWKQQVEWDFRESEAFGTSKELVAGTRCGGRKGLGTLRNNCVYCVAQKECIANQLKPISSPANPADVEVSQGRFCALFTLKTPRPTHSNLPKTN